MLELAQEYGGDLLDFMKKYGKLQNKGFPQHISCGKVMEYIGHPVHRGQNFLSTNIRFMGIKKPRVLHRLQKYQLKIAKRT
jgi:hypothetical protein